MTNAPQPRLAPKVLVAEDSPVQAEYIRSLLEEHDFDVRLAANGRVALAMAKVDRPDLIISDVVMPEMDGYSLCRAIRADADLTDIPVVLVTTLTNAADIIEGMNCGADNFVTKPYERQSLVSRVDYLLANRTLRGSSRLSSNLRIEIDGTTHVITAGREQMLDLLMSVYGEAARFNEELKASEISLREANERLEQTVAARTAELRVEIDERRQAETLLRDAIESMAGGIAIFNAEERLAICNEEYRRHLSTISDLIVPGVRFEDLARAAVARGQYADVVGDAEEWLAGMLRRFRMREGIIERQLVDDRWVLVTYREMTNGWTAGLRIDITETREAQKREEALQQQLAQAQKMEAIGNLTGGMAHDFNNLLSVITANLDIAREQIIDNNDLDELLGEALDAAWRGADLTRRLLAFARRQPLRPERIEINERIADVVRLLRRLLGEDVEVLLDLGPDIWPIVADPAQLEACLTNLATNARDAMPRGGQLLLATANRHLDSDYVDEHAEATEGDFVMIEITDTGFGMPPEVMNRIFEPFFTTKEAGKGTGLGLSMVFGFLRQSGGHVGVYSELGKGTTFRLYLPRDVTEAQMRELETGRRVERGGGKIVLVVEDNPAVRRIVVRQLRTLDYQVLECERAAEALDLLQNEPVDLLFTDIVMPGGVDGVELARIARERWSSLKIVLTSGFPQARFDTSDQQLRGVELISKPYRREELATVLHRALRDGNAKGG